MNEILDSLKKSGFQGLVLGDETILIKIVLIHDLTNIVILDLELDGARGGEEEGGGEDFLRS
eukprot:CAMPEP_0168627772 /NCGR_PEP_ID=MMETSP0449_2-20121227/11455_1 /TAXON_ID=1082188 /ORGANISM="Strombidium rassoulzadegani, Strain ras09" /LENGTH=61 /DNA_ID=CAMNT_0008670079 /DNA_START=356 /DNA_END=541 /DNA_ORIENTATION=-